MAIAIALLFALLVLPGTAGTDTCAADDHECRGAADAAAADAAAAAVDATDADAAAAAVAAPQPPLRFQVGDIVLANMGRGSWKLGRIEHLHHREAHWPAGESSPYAIALDEGGGVYAPEDSEHVVRRASDADVRRLQQAAALEARAVQRAGARVRQRGSVRPRSSTQYCLFAECRRGQAAGRASPMILTSGTSATPCPRHEV